MGPLALVYLRPTRPHLQRLRNDLLESVLVKDLGRVSVSASYSTFAYRVF